MSTEGPTNVMPLVDPARRTEVRFESEGLQQVYLDYSSLTGQEPDRKGARDLVEEWAAVLGNLEATQHFIGPPTVTIDGDEATAVAYFQAQHRLHNVTGGEKWTLAASRRRPS